MAYWLYCQSCKQWSKSNAPMSDDMSCPYCANPYAASKPNLRLSPEKEIADQKQLQESVLPEAVAEDAEAPIINDEREPEEMQIKGQEQEAAEVQEVGESKVVLEAIEVAENIGDSVVSSESMDLVENEVAESCENPETQEVEAGSEVAEVPEAAPEVIEEDNKTGDHEAEKSQDASKIQETLNQKFRRNKNHR